MRAGNNIYSAGGLRPSRLSDKTTMEFTHEKELLDHNLNYHCSKYDHTDCR